MSDIYKINSLLMEMPLYKELMLENQKLQELVFALQHTVKYLEMTNEKQKKRAKKYKKRCEHYQKDGNNDDDDDTPVFVETKHDTKHDDYIVDITNDDDVRVADVVVKDEPPVKMEILNYYSTDEDEDDSNPLLAFCSPVSAKQIVKKEEAVVKGEEEVVVEEEEEVVVEEEEEVVVEEEEEVVVKEEEKEVVEEEEEEEEKEEVVVKEKEEEKEMVVEEEVESEELMEIEIEDKIYYVSDENNSIIYEFDEEGNAIEVGKMTNGEVEFYETTE